MICKQCQITFSCNIMSFLGIRFAGMGNSGLRLRQARFWLRVQYLYPG